MMRASSRPAALKQVQTELALTAVAKAENIEISDEEYEAEVAKLAEQYNMPAEQVKALRQKSGHGINDFLLPLYQGEAFEPGSTDVGDVSWLTPTAQFTAVTFASGSPGHSWQNVSLGRSSIGHKGVIYAAKVLAASVCDLMTDPDLLNKAKAEFADTAAEGYDCPLEKDLIAGPQAL
jgi:aminobenzoyl-glutamate utilization protein B